MLHLEEFYNLISKQTDSILAAVLYHIVQTDQAGGVGRDGLVEVTHRVPALGLLVEHHRLVQRAHGRGQPS